MLVAAMNPRPCGYHGDPVKECTCSITQVLRYQKKISGPLLDRIDIHIDVPGVEYDKLTGDRLGEPSAEVGGSGISEIIEASHRSAEATVQQPVPYDSQVRMACPARKLARSIDGEYSIK